MAKFLKGTTGQRIVGGLIGGAADALYTRYIEGMLPTSVAKYNNWVKAGIGLVIPMIAKGNRLCDSIGDGLLTVGFSDGIQGLLGSTAGQSGVPARQMVGAAPFRQFARRANVRRNISGTPTAAAKMVGNVLC